MAHQALNNMSKLFTFALAFALHQSCIAQNTYFEIENVRINLPHECEVLDASKHTLLCKRERDWEDYYIAVRDGNTYESNILKSERKKDIYKIDENYFAKIIVNGEDYYFLYLKKCNIAIHGQNPGFIFSMMTDIKIDNASCR